MKPFPLGVGLIALAIAFSPTIARPVVFTVDTTIETSNTSYDGQDIVVSNAVLTVDGPHNFNSLQLASGAVLTHTADSSGVPTTGLNLDVTGNLEVETGASINANGRGYSLGQGLGLGSQAGFPASGGGGGHGGYGGVSSTNAAGGIPFGSPFEPTSPGGCGGSGLGGFGGAGGGLVHLVVSGNLVLNGRITVTGLNATNSRSGGGAGGSISVTAQTISGNGNMTASGGAGEPIHGGGGAGGRIAIEFTTNLFTGSVTATGGNGWQRGGAGTVFRRVIGMPGEVSFDNGGIAGAATLIEFNESADLVIQGSAAALVASPQALRNLTVRSNSSLTTTATNNATLALTATGAVVVENSASLSVNGKGFPANQGNGSGQPSSVVGSGAGHGGYGGSGQTGTAVASGGNYYGSLTGPVTFGSGGRTVGTYLGGAGGGSVRLTIVGNLRLDGSITADGTGGAGSYGGGASGGGVWLTLGGFSGSGTISASGGSGGLPYGGGGAGGRIAVTYASNSFNGMLIAAGGMGAVAGGAGTIYTKRNTSAYADLIVDNGGLSGTNTVLDVNGSFSIAVRNGAVLRNIQRTLTLGQLNVGTASALVLAPPQDGQTTLTVVSNLVIAAGGAISGDGLGFASGIGVGAGLSSPFGSTGGGHGGYGGRGAGFTNSVPPGGNIYDSTAAPTTAGSGGGGNGGTGGTGGGAIRLTVSGQMIVDGRLSVDGLDTVTNNAGGGAGGSLYLTLNQFSGSGTISANGGSGHLPNGGGGGGGRIAITWNSNSFIGSFSARGGNGFVAGGAGTIYLKANNRPYPDLTFDNGGLVGTNTVLDITSIANLTIGSGASVTSLLSSVLISSNLTIGANASWRASQLTLNIGGAANIAAGGNLGADAVSTSGPGSGTYNALGSSGGGHGGYGGRGLGAANGGNVYDLSSNPQQPGSPGLAGGGSPGASPGGGTLRMTVEGPVILNGTISANGGNVFTNNGGGGSGGSIWLTLNRLSGSGSISANGGSGHLPNGGGGGGGRVAIYYTSNSFTGVISARGGNGFGAGGAGTIYLKANNQSYPNLIVDNGGLPGTNTVLDVSSLLNLTVGPGGSLISSLSVSSVTINSNLTIGANAVWRASGLTLNVGGTVNIAADGGINADGTSSFGPGGGQGSSLGSSGGGHGGYGGRGAASMFGGNVYDSISNPLQAGSPGGFINLGGGITPAGGGSLRMSVSGPFILNGRISANGSSITTNSGGGGSGGSVWLTLNQISGSGTISANGGLGHLPNGGGGGGGRVALYFNTNSFTGSLSAKGGNGFVGGGAGTIYLKANNNQLPNLIVDNGGLSGTNTMIDLGTLSNLTVMGGAIVRPSLSTLSLGSLNITTNSALLASSSAAMLTLNISGAVNVAPGGSISADGLGYTSGIRVSGGAGQTGSPGSGGGGHGGYGGRGLATSVGVPPGAGGNAYDSLINPTLPGGGGGGLNLNGGAGGGTLHLNVTGPMTLGGRISANGLGTSTNGGGGGAGGSVWLSLNELIGNGTITADGGSGHLPNGGGGGGGRISLSYNFLKGNFPTNGFTGSYSAKGGAGYVKGGAGTIYVRTNFSNIANVFVDNGGTRGTNTLVSGAASFDLYIQGAAVATSLGSPRDLFVRTNSWVAQTGNLSVTRNATFDAGGGINLDGLSRSTIGNGSTLSNPKGGGGHGGYGALNPPGAGTAYDSAISPNLDGGSGGNGSGTSVAPFGGTGGGNLHLTVSGALLLNGELSANGLDGDFNSGGGAGGSLWLQTGILAGSGRMTTVGGNGNGTAGGGGGGRIAVSFITNQFAGLLSACGGSGSVFGGAGTIFMRNNLTGLTSLVLDNCGNTGVSTPLSSAIGLATNLTVTQGAVAEMQGTIPIFSNLVVSAGGTVTSGRTDTNLFLALLGNLTVTEGSGIITDAKGFARDNGPGAGATLDNQGGGGSYGGWGGDSASGAYGGLIYGSPSRPVDRGSGGGSGSGFPAAGSEGGGAIRLAVAGTVAVDGLISASGGLGWQDDSGGGSGGSVWISTRQFTGGGTLATIGGDGDFYGGGGGGGGRIAIYSPMNTFTGLVSVVGGDGANFGEAGTIFTSGSLSGFDVVSQTPTGLVSNVVSEVALEFSEPINVVSVGAGDVRIYTPYGPLPEVNQSFSLLSPTTLRVSFNPQNIPGDYRIEVGPAIEGLLASHMSQIYTGAFSITLPMISGTVTNSSGQPVADVTLLPDGGLMGATTDVGGNYSLGVPPGWSGAVTPVFGTNMFVPGQLSYAAVTSSMAGQNYLLVATIAPLLNSGLTGAGLTLNWNGIPGVTYQPESSTNLVDWLPYGPPLPGTNGVMQLLVPTGADPMQFVRLRVAN